MTATFLALLISAVTISFLHTASGPDHYLPFIVLSRSRKWTLRKTIILTIICGFGHILSSIILGLIGLVLGWQLNKLDFIQNIRGNISSYILLTFGTLYLIYGLWYAYRNRPHKHFDVMGDEVYVFKHKHGETVMPDRFVKVTPFVLFAVFVMGPNEPLIPLLFFSGIERSISEIGILIGVFSLSTVLTMLAMVLIGIYGYSFFNTQKLERWVHAIGGAVVCLCAAGIAFFNW